MRNLLAVVLVLGNASFAMPQEGRARVATEPPPRFGVAFKGKVYSQASPKESLESAIAAADKGEFNYLVAQLLDPAFVDARLADRARQVEPTIEANLAALRDFQQQNLDRIALEARVPTDPMKFRERVAAEAQAAAFKQLTRDVREKFAEDPQVLKDLRRFRRQGTFPDDKTGGETAKVALPDVKDRFLFFKKIGDRWYVENRQADIVEAAKTPEPEKK